MSKFILVKSDVSGIQDFIFNVNSKGASQTLKARSFFIKILLYLVMQKVFDDFSISDKKEIEKAKISTSGGNFFLKLKVENPELIDDIQSELTRALKYTGLNMMLTYVFFQEEKYSETLKLLNQKTRERKYNLLGDYDDFFEPFDKDFIIDVYGKTNTKGENKKWHGITRQLKKRNNTLLIVKKDQASQLFKIKNDKIELLGYEISFGQGGIKLNEFLESIFPLKSPDTYSYGDDVIKFEELAKGGYFYRENNKKKSVYFSQRGINKLGVLAMDVDNLGIALEGVDSEQKHKTFDKDLRSFFNKTIESIIENQFKKNGVYNIYTVNAGGDDSFFVGKWNTIIDLAIAIKKEFYKKIKSKYSKVDISAAIVIVDPNFPILRFSQMVMENLKDAKYKYSTKGNISILGEVFKWDIFENDVLKMRKDFLDLLKNNVISSGLLAKARKVAHSVLNNSGMKLSDYWEISYYLRSTKMKKLKPWQKQKREKLLKSYSKYLNKADNEKNPMLKKNYRLVFPFAARLAELDKR